MFCRSARRAWPLAGTIRATPTLHRLQLSSCRPFQSTGTKGSQTSRPSSETSSYLDDLLDSIEEDVPNRRRDPDVAEVKHSRDEQDASDWQAEWLSDASEAETTTNGVDTTAWTPTASSKVTQGTNSHMMEEPPLDDEEDPQVPFITTDQQRAQQGAIAALPALASFLGNKPTPGEIFDFLKSGLAADAVDVGVAAVGEAEEQVLVDSIKQMTAAEFAHDNYVDSGKSLVEHGSTLQLLQNFQRLRICTPLLWTTALCTSASLLCTNFRRYEQGIRMESDESHQQPRSGFDMKKLHGFGIQIDSLLRLWRELFRLGDVNQIHHSLRNPWLLMRVHQIDPFPAKTFPAALCRYLGPWTRDSEPALVASIAGAALLTAPTVLSSRSIFEILSRDQRTQSNVQDVRQISDEIFSNHSLDLLEGSQQSIDDRGFLRWMANSMAAVAPNRTLTKISLGAVSVESSDVAWVEQFIDAAPRILEPLVQKGEDRSHEMAREVWVNSRDHHICRPGRFDHIIAKHIASLPLEPLALADNTRQWITSIDRTYFELYSQWQLYAALESVLSRGLGGTSRERGGMRILRNSIRQERSAIMLHWRKNLSARIRALAQARDVHALDRLWPPLIARSREDFGQFPLLWYYQRLTASARLGAKRMRSTFNIIRPYDLGLTVVSWRRLANHCLRLAADSNSDLVEHIVGRFKAFKIRPDEKTARWMLRHSMRFQKLDQVTHWPAICRRESADDTPLRHESAIVLHRTVKSLVASSSAPHVTTDLCGLTIGLLVANTVMTSNRKLDDVARSRDLLIDPGRHGKSIQTGRHGENMKIDPQTTRALLDEALDVCETIQQRLVQFPRDEVPVTFRNAMSKYRNTLLVLLRKSTVAQAKLPKRSPRRAPVWRALEMDVFIQLNRAQALRDTVTALFEQETGRVLRSYTTLYYTTVWASSHIILKYLAEGLPQRALVWQAIEMDVSIQLNRAQALRATVNALFEEETGRVPQSYATLYYTTVWASRHIILKYLAGSGWDNFSRRPAIGQPSRLRRSKT